MASLSVYCNHLNSPKLEDGYFFWSLWSIISKTNVANWWAIFADIFTELEERIAYYETKGDIEGFNYSLNMLILWQTVYSNKERR